MAKVAVVFAPGCEEVEGLTIVDVLRRMGIETTMVGL
ncbi:UNVERIFIED_CONTAM: DJ-1 family protein, partial [Lactobacillus helveticus]|nr:DJ-1 family protein [Lactobacillus helveticus]